MPEATTWAPWKERPRSETSPALVADVSALVVTMNATASVTATTAATYLRA